MADDSAVALSKSIMRGAVPNQYGDVILPFTMLCRPTASSNPAKNHVGANSATIR